MLSAAREGAMLTVWSRQAQSYQPAQLTRAPTCEAYDASNSESRSTREVLIFPLPKLYSPAVNAGLAPRTGSGAVVRMPRLPRRVLSQRTLKSPWPSSVSKAAAGRERKSSAANAAKYRFKKSPGSEAGGEHPWPARSKGRSKSQAVTFPCVLVAARVAQMQRFGPSSAAIRECADTTRRNCIALHECNTLSVAGGASLRQR